MTEGGSCQPVFYQSADGLALFARDYGSAGFSKMPVLCLPGLTRSSKDFVTVTGWLSRHRRVIVPDFRGRGRSQYSPDAMTYRPVVELADTIALLDHLGLERAAIIGTSRGGIVAMLMAALHRPRVSGILLNDIGPTLEAAGLLRIRSYLGVRAAMNSWDAAVAGLKRTNPGFLNLSDEAWHAFAHRLFVDHNGVPELDYDAGLAQTFPSLDEITAGKVAELWELFNSLKGLPVSVLRGENSDLLSAETVSEMKASIDALDATTVLNRGHAPFLDETESTSAIKRWLMRVDENS